MKTHTRFLKISVLCLSVLLSFSSCKKKKAFKEEDGQTSIDNRDVQSENDAAVNDINDAIGQQSKLRGKGESTTETSGVMGDICGLTVDTLGLSSGSIRLVYNGTTCNNRKRTGAIRLTIQDYSNGKRWKDAGCVLKVEYQAYKITRSSDSKSIQLDGVQYITNETGGSWFEFLILKTQASLGSNIKGTGLSVTFEDGQTASYNIHRRITYTLPNNKLTCTGEGIGSLNGISNLENYGLTRDGDEFTSQVSTPIVWNLTCGWWAPIQGEVKIKVDNKDFELKCLFSVDTQGNAVASGDNDCAYGWKVEWKYKNKTKKKVIKYL